MPSLTLRSSGGRWFGSGDGVSNRGCAVNHASGKSLRRGWSLSLLLFGRWSVARPCPGAAGWFKCLGGDDGDGHG